MHQIQPVAPTNGCALRFGSRRHGSSRRRREAAPPSSSWRGIGGAPPGSSRPGTGGVRIPAVPGDSPVPTRQFPSPARYTTPSSSWCVVGYALLPGNSLCHGSSPDGAGSGLRRREKYLVAASSGLSSPVALGCIYIQRRRCARWCRGGGGGSGE